MAKSCLSVDPDEEKSIQQLYREREIDIKVPLYVSQTCKLAKVVPLFQKGHTHLAVICKDDKSSQNLRDYADRVHN